MLHFTRKVRGLRNGGKFVIDIWAVFRRSPSISLELHCSTLVNTRQSASPRTRTRVRKTVGGSEISTIKVNSHLSELRTSLIGGAVIYTRYWVEVVAWPVFSDHLGLIHFCSSSQSIKFIKKEHAPRNLFLFACRTLEEHPGGCEHRSLNLTVARTVTMGRMCRCK